MINAEWLWLLIVLLSGLSFFAALVLATLIGMRDFFRPTARRWARVCLFWLLCLVCFGLILLSLGSEHGHDF